MGVLTDLDSRLLGFCHFAEVRGHADAGEHRIPRVHENAPRGKSVIQTNHWFPTRPFLPEFQIADRALGNGGESGKFLL
ncbi:hypothetical protein GCM10009602_38100 [Nocardiopsis tropica]